MQYGGGLSEITRSKRKKLPENTRSKEYHPSGSGPYWYVISGSSLLNCCFVLGSFKVAKLPYNKSFAKFVLLFAFKTY